MDIQLHLSQIFNELSHCWNISNIIQTYIILKLLFIGVERSIISISYVLTDIENKNLFLRNK